MHHQRNTPNILLMTLSFLLIFVAVAQAGKIPIQCPRKCDVSHCPTVGSVKVEDCPRDLVVYDFCGCCRRCNVSAPAMKAVTNQEEACSNIKCSKKEICVLNFQGLPICRCLTDQMCRRYNMQFQSKMKVCGSNGESYPSRCHLNVASCKSDRKIRVASLGVCPINNTDLVEKLTSTVEFTPIRSQTLDDSEMLRGSLSSIGNRPASGSGKLRELSTKELRRLLRKGDLSPREIERAKLIIRDREDVDRPSKFSRASGSHRRYKQMRKSLT